MSIDESYSGAKLHLADQEIIRLRSRVAELEAFILRNSDPYDMTPGDTETFHEIGKRLIPQNY